MGSMNGNYVKMIGVKFDVLNGLEVIHDFNQKNFSEAGKIADENSKQDRNIIFIGVPCSFQMSK